MPEQRPVALVTGGSRGIGALVVRACAAAGQAVVIASRKLENCQDLSERIETEYGVPALPIAFNASNWDDCGRLVDQVYDAFGRVDLLVNNAGLSPRYDSLPEVSEALFDKVVAVNLRGPFRLMALVGERMRSSGSGGSIVNIGSSAAIRPDPGALPYSAAKAGLHTLTEGFAQALAPDVRVNTVQPGPVLTDIADGWPPGQRERLADTVAMRRCAEPEEIVGAVMYLAGPGASYTTGSVIRVDGGWP